MQYKWKKTSNTKITVAEEILHLNRVTGYNLACIISVRIKFFSYSRTTDIWNYYPNVQQRYFLGDDHDVHKCDSTKNLADCFSDLNLLFSLKNIIAFRLIMRRTDTQPPPPTPELFQIIRRHTYYLREIYTHPSKKPPESVASFHPPSPRQEWSRSLAFHTHNQ